MTVQSTTQTTATTVAQYSSSQKTTTSSFDETLNQTQDSTQTSHEPSEASKEAYFKNVERVSYEFIKNTPIEKMDEVYADLDKEEIDKFKVLHEIANISGNDTLNQVLFNKAKDMSMRDALSLSFQTSSQMFHYKNTGTGQRFLVEAYHLKPDAQGRLSLDKDAYLSTEEAKLSHTEAFQFLLDMVNSSKDGMKSPQYSSETKELFEEVFNDYSQILEDYNALLKKNLTGNV